MTRPASESVQRSDVVLPVAEANVPRDAVPDTVAEVVPDAATQAEPVDVTVLWLLLAAVLATFTAQQLLIPVLAPLSREVRLSELQLGAVMATAAVAFTTSSLFWGGRIDVWGRRAVVLAGLTCSTAGLVLFAVVGALALDGATTPTTTFVLMLVARSALFGFGIGAVPVATLAYVAATSRGERDRTKRVAQMGAMQSLGLVLGPALGGLLAVWSLTAPLYLAPVGVAAVAIAVAIRMPRRATPAADAPVRPRAARVSPFEPRVRSFIAVGFLLFLAFGIVQVVMGFVIQDRLGLGPQETAFAVGASGFAAGVVLVALQAVVVPRLAWGPARLLRLGAPVSVAGFVVLTAAPEFWSMTAGLMLISAGLGLAIPGYTAGASLAAGDARQGSLAGTLNASIGSTFILGPLVSTALYEIEPASPLVLGGALTAIATIFVFVDATIRPRRHR